MDQVSRCELTTGAKLNRIKMRFRSTLTRETAPSFNGRTADSGSAYRGSNPWGAAKSFQSLT